MDVDRVLLIHLSKRVVVVPVRRAVKDRWL
jgi:hypothetical protein